MRVNLGMEVNFLGSGEPLNGTFNKNVSKILEIDKSHAIIPSDTRWQKWRPTFDKMASTV